MTDIPKKLGRLVTALSLGMDYRELWFEAENGTIFFVSLRWNEREGNWEVMSTTRLDRKGRR